MRGGKIIGGAICALLFAAPVTHARLRWSEPERVGAGTQAAPLLDARGDALVVFQEAGALSYSWRAPRGEWTAPRQLAAHPAPGYAAITPLGEALVAWPEERRVKVAVARPGGRFRLLDTIELPGRQLGALSLVMDDAGNAALAIQDRAAGENMKPDTVRVAMRRAGGRFAAPEVVGGGSTGGGAYVAMNPAGAAVVSWQLSEGGTMAAYRPPAGSFGPAEAVPFSTQMSWTPAAVDAQGQAYIAGSGWTPVYPDPSTGTELVVRSPLGGWSEPVRLATGGHSNQVLLEPNGVVSFVGDRSDDSGRGRVATFASRLPSGELVGPDDISPQASCAPGVAMNLAGEMLATWSRNCDSLARGTRVAVAERLPGGAFGQEEMVSGSDSIGSAAALNEARQAVVTWGHTLRSGDPSSWELQAVVREDPTLPTLPFPPDVDVDVPARPELDADGTIAVPVTCSRSCKVSAAGLLFAGRRNPSAWVKRGKSRRLRARRRAKVRLRFGSAAALKARRARRPWISVSVTARGKSPRPVTFSRRIRLR